MATTPEELYNNDLDSFLNKNSLSQWVSITQSNSDAMIWDGAINASKIKNLSVDTLDVSTTGHIRSGKTSFTDTANSWWFLSWSWVFIGNAWNTKNIKYDINAWTFVMSGITLSWADVSWTGKPSDNATVWAQFWVNITWGSSGANYVSNSWYVTTITWNSITTWTIIVGSWLVWLQVNSWGDIVMESETYSSVSAISFTYKNNANRWWDIYFTPTGGWGYNAWELVFEPQSSNSWHTIAIWTTSYPADLSVNGSVLPDKVLISTSWRMQLPVGSNLYS